MSREGARAVVIGGGAIGLAVARELGRRGRQVVLVEGGEPGGGTTRTSFAWVNAYSKAPRDYFDLNRAGVEAHRSLAAEGDGQWLAMTGRLEWAVDPNERRGLAERAARTLDWGDPVRRLAPAEGRALEPDVRIPDDAEAWFFPNEGHLFIDRFVARLVADAVAAGVQLVTGQRVVGFERAGDDLAAVLLDDGSRLAADDIVSCAGRWTGAIAGLASGRVAMLGPDQPSRVPGFLGYTPPVDTRLGRILSAPGLMVRPESGGRLILQASEFDRDARADAPPPVDGELGRLLLARARAILDRFDVERLEELRVGVRSIPADGLPVVGRVPGTGGLYAVATHSGLTLAILLGRLVADEIVTGRTAPELAPFRPERFARPMADAAR